MAAVRKRKELEARLGHVFKNRALLKKALTHASVRQASAKRRDNERLGGGFGDIPAGEVRWFAWRWRS